MRTSQTRAREAPSRNFWSESRTPAEKLDQPRDFGRYRLTERLAVGGMAEIFKALVTGDRGFSRTVVVKSMLPQLAEDREFVRLFIDEARVMGRLNHPKIVQVLDFGEVEGRLFIAMEYVDGYDLLEVLRMCAERRLRMPLGVAAHIVAEVLDALDYAHSAADEDGSPLQIVHRDVSPSNIFLSRHGDVKLGDFGLVDVGLDGRRSQPGLLKGKYGYLAPEQLVNQPADHRADIFAAGVVLAELLINRRLFAAANDLDLLLHVRDARLDRLTTFGGHVPEDLRGIAEAALRRDRALRYQSAASFRDALLHFLFQDRRMVTNAHVRRLLDHLEGKGQPSPSANGVKGDAPVVREIGNKRKIALVPPPKPVEPDDLRDKGEERRLPTDEALKALPELRPPEDRDLHEAATATGLPRADALPNRAVGQRSSGAPQRSGNLEQKSLLANLFEIARGEETGLLVLASGEVIKEIHTVDGHPQSITSNQKEELFGQYLVRRQVITDGELSMALAMLPRFSGRLGDTLVGLGLLSPIDVLQHLTHQVRQKMLDTFAWTDGRFAYHPGQTTTYESAPLGLDAFELLGAGVWAMPAEVVSVALEPLLDERLVRLSELPVPLEVFRLGPLGERFVAQLDGKRSLREILDTAPTAVQRHQFARVCYLLHETGMLGPAVTAPSSER